MARKRADEATAYHEAGHAVVSHFLRRPVKTAVLTRDDPDRLGYYQGFKRQAELEAIEYDPVDRSSWKPAIPRLMVLYAGQLAEEMFTGKRDHVGAGSDDEQIADLIGRVTGGEDEEGAALARWVELRTQNFLKRPIHWLAVRRVAAALLEHQKLTRDQIVAACGISGQLGNNRLISEVEVEMEAARKHLRAIDSRRRRASRRRRPGWAG